MGTLEELQESADNAHSRIELLLLRVGKLEGRAGVLEAMPPKAGADVVIELNKRINELAQHVGELVSSCPSKAELLGLNVRTSKLELRADAMGHRVGKIETRATVLEDAKSPSHGSQRAIVDSMTALSARIDHLDACARAWGRLDERVGKLETAATAGQQLDSDSSGGGSNPPAATPIEACHWVFAVDVHSLAKLVREARDAESYIRLFVHNKSAANRADALVEVLKPFEGIR